MSKPREGKTYRTLILRAIALVGGLLFLAMALRLGAASLQARSAGSTMSNGKGGTMAYQDGFKVTVVFGAFAAAFCYFAFRPLRREMKSEPNAGIVDT